MARYTILVVDDDPALLDIVTAVLEEPGWTVLRARDGYEAVRIIAERHVDLLLTDVVMPGLNGIELSAQARLMRPHVHVIFMSGYHTSPDPSFGVLLPKPVRAADLIDAVEREVGHIR